ncbi:transposase [Marinomonas spartinae]|uniref:transposase n=1 Tax=Marinomonas spartinae TaxID=1792290 RepID=UPI0008343B8E
MYTKDQHGLGKFKSYCCHLVLYKGKPKGRHSLNQDGSTKASKTSLTAARGAKEPWLLVSSFPKNRSFAKKSVKVYQTRMQIEESFRDIKSTKFGLGFEHNHTKK